MIFSCRSHVRKAGTGCESATMNGLEGPWTLCRALVIADEILGVGGEERERRSRSGLEG